MSEKDKAKSPIYDVLKYASIGVGGCAAVLILVGAQLSLISFVQLGLLMVFVCVITGIFTFLWKLENEAEKAEISLEQEAISEEIVLESAEETDFSEEIETTEDKSQEYKKRVVTPQKRLRNYREKILPVMLLLVSALGIVGEFLIFKYLRKTPSGTNLSIVLVSVLSILASMALIIVTNLLSNPEEERKQQFTILKFYYLAIRWMAFIAAGASLLSFFGLWQVDLVLNYILGALLIVLFIEIFIQCGVWLIDGTNAGISELQIYILPAIFSGKNPIEYVLKSLEDKAGISLRSTWTLYFIRKNVTMVILIMVVLFWGMTCFVQINPEQEGLVYSLGQLKSEESLKPGVHLKLPWPFEIVKTYNTAEIKYFTVGFETDQLSRENYLWGSGHNISEYVLLLGNGKELASMNIAIFYKISDLYNYVKQFDNPVEVLQAEAYEILLGKIVESNLDQLLSLDRSSLSRELEERLAEIAADRKLGIKPMAVNFSGIHPAIGVVDVYQGVVSADIDKNTTILNAQAYADYSIPQAEQSRNESIAKAEIEAVTRMGESLSEVYLYEFRKDAYSLNKSSYELWKWLEAFENSVAGRELYLIDKNIRNENILMDLRPSATNSGSILNY